MEKINEAKKYMNKIVYTASDFDNRGKYKIEALVIGGVNLFFNQVDYDVLGFHLFTNSKCNESWGDVKKEDIVDKFDSTKGWGRGHYFFSREEAEKYREWLQKDEVERERESDVEQAKDLLKKHKIEFEIFS